MNPATGVSPGPIESSDSVDGLNSEIGRSSRDAGFMKKLIGGPAASHGIDDCPVGLCAAYSRAAVPLGNHSVAQGEPAGPGSRQMYPDASSFNVAGNVGPMKNACSFLQ